MVKIIKDYYTKNRCYTNNINYKKVGIIVHSTATKGVMAKTFRDRWNNPTILKAVHAFLDDKEVIECLPETRRAWHVGTAVGNNYYYGFEICEDKNHTEEYFLKAYRNAVEYTAVMVKRLGLSVSDVLSHKEGNRKGIASNHGDPEHWFNKFGYDMHRFRSDLQKELNGEVKPVEPVVKNGIKVDGHMGPETITALQGYFGTIQDGKISTPSMMVIELQKGLGVTVDGILGPVTIKALQKHLGTPQDGVISRPSMMVKALQDRLNKGNLNLKTVKPVEPPKAPQPAPPKDTVLPDGKFFRVVVGSYQSRNNATEMQDRLKKAGFDSFLVIFEK